MVTNNKQNTEDVEMKNVDSPNTENLMISAGDSNGKNMISNGDPDLQTLEDIKEQAKHIEKYVSTKEIRFMLRVLRNLVPTRKKLNHKVLRKIVTSYYTHSQSARENLLQFIDEPMDTDSNLSSFKGRIGKQQQVALLPELDVYFNLLILLHLIDLERYEQVGILMMWINHFY